MFDVMATTFPGSPSGPGVTCVVFILLIVLDNFSSVTWGGNSCVGFEEVSLVLTFLAFSTLSLGNKASIILSRVTMSKDSVNSATLLRSFPKPNR